MWITARGYDGVLRPGDRIHVSGRRRPATGRPSNGRELVTVDDWPGHHLQLEA